MSSMWGQHRGTVRPPSPGRFSFFPCLLVFAATAAVVYGWGRGHLGPVTPRHPVTATAYLIEGPNGPVLESGEAKATRIPVKASDLDPRRAAELANSFADREASQRRAAWRRQAETLLDEARQTAEKARRDYRESIACLATAERQLQETLHEPAQSQKTDSASVAKPSMIDNPARAELEKKIVDLQHQQERLLVDRTPLHPAVQELAVKIADFEAQLATIPAQIPNPQADVVGESSKASAIEAEAVNRLVQELKQKREELATTVAKARQASEEAAIALEQANQRQKAEPQLSIQYAEVAPTVAPKGKNNLQLVATALAASLLMTFGVGSTLFGVGIEPPIESVQQLEAEIEVPVFGVVPTDQPAVDENGTEARVRQRRAAIAIGLILMGACPLAAVLGVVWF